MGGGGFRPVAWLADAGTVQPPPGPPQLFADGDSQDVRLVRRAILGEHLHGDHVGRALSRDQEHEHECERSGSDELREWLKQQPRGMSVLQQHPEPSADRMWLDGVVDD